MLYMLVLTFLSAGDHLENNEKMQPYINELSRSPAGISFLAPIGFLSYVCNINSVGRYFVSFILRYTL